MMMHDELQCIIMEISLDIQIVVESFSQQISMANFRWFSMLSVSFSGKVIFDTLSPPIVIG